MRSASRALWCAVLLLPAAVLAQGVEQPLQRFHFSDPAYLQQPQQLQLSAGLRWRGDEGDGNFTVPLQLQFGASERFEFTGDVELAFPRPLTGSLRAVQRAEAAVTMGLIDDASRGVVVSAGAGLVGSRDRLDNSMDPGGVPRVSALVKRGPMLANVELSVDLVSRNDELDATPRAALGFALDFGRLQPVFEAMYENDDAPAGTFALGLRFQALESLELGVAAPVEVRDDETFVGVTGQLVWNLGG